LNYFCETCAYKNIPWFMKEKFNKVVKPTFLECPLNDEKVIGCLIKNINIDWKKFVQYLLEHQAITQEEINKLLNLGWDLRDGG